MIQFDEEKQQKRLDEVRQKEEEELLKTLAAARSIPYVNLVRTPINMEALRLVPEQDARAGNIGPFEVVGKRLDVSLLSPDNPAAKKIVEGLERRGMEVRLHITNHESLEKVWSRYKDLSFATETKAGAINISSEDIARLLTEVKNLPGAREKIKEIIAAKTGHHISRVLEVTIAGAIAIDASDIHFEPEESYVRLRYRLDGILQDVLELDRGTFDMILSRVKLLSGLKLNLREEAQDGRFSVSIQNIDIEIRTSVIPGAYGESIVLRILNPKTISIPFEELGMHETFLPLVAHEIKKPNGMILNTGPTGSGKTTTLYAFLKKVHTEDVKIITIEDPIEYHLPGIVQTQVNEETNYTFVEGLRSALRQDPDIIMVGEIRDRETAEIAINAALTGHLVFSTLHTNNAAGAFPRLIDLGVQAKIIGSAINFVMAQRLVRRLCSACKKKVPVPAERTSVVEKIARDASAKGIKVPSTESVFEAGGCNECNDTGYRGRIGVFEGIRVDEAVEGVVRESPSEREVRRAAAAQKILTMREDGILKALLGITSLAELERVTDIERE